MVTDQQVRRLMKLKKKGKTLWLAAAKAGMDEKTARKYLRLGKIPSEVKTVRGWRTRDDPFSEVWEDVRAHLVVNPGLEAKTLFEDLQRRYPGRFQDGQLRTLQRRVKTWRALEGPPKEVFFEQVYEPGKLCESDFTHLSSLAITIQGQDFQHLLYHFVLPYSNWETGTVCFSESFENLSEGLQNALWELGGVPEEHRTDRLSTAVHQEIHPERFTQRYKALLEHYGLKGQRIQASQPNENGDVEQRHHRFKVSLDQALMLRGSRDFVDRKEYQAFLRRLFSQLNVGRQNRFLEEVARLRALPKSHLDACNRLEMRVRHGSTIRVNNNTYSVDSRLIGEKVQVRVYAEQLEVWYAQRQVETLPRLRGEGKHRIEYRHIIDWLVRKPGAFDNYRYRDDLFPTSRFRIAYDILKQSFSPARASKEYLLILELAAYGSEAGVDSALGYLIRQGEPFTSETVESILLSGQEVFRPTEVVISEVDLKAYDGLLEGEEVTA
jgi:hypothetical protein